MDMSASENIYVPMDEDTSEVQSDSGLQTSGANTLPNPLPPTHDPSAAPHIQRRLQRHSRIPAPFEDIQPEGCPPLQPPTLLPSMAPGSSALPRVILHVRDSIRTGQNRFGILREYPHRPSYDPDGAVGESELSDSSAIRTAGNSIEIDDNHSSEQTGSQPPPWPFKNLSTYLLMEWMITGSNHKSIGEMDCLVNNVLCSNNFKLDDVSGFSARQETARLDSAEADASLTPFSYDGWMESIVKIFVPTGSKNSTGIGRPVPVPGLHHRSLCAVMKAAIADVTSWRFHFSPFKRFWKLPSGEEERCYDEAYTSDAWIKTHDDLQKQSNEPGCKLEKVVLGLMFWSDSTHLTSFGTAKVWPLYMFFGNLSKYVRSKPNSGACHHVAYIPSVSTRAVFCPVSRRKLTICNSFLTPCTIQFLTTPRSQLLLHIVDES